MVDWRSIGSVFPYRQPFDFEQLASPVSSWYCHRFGQIYRPHLLHHRSQSLLDVRHDHRRTSLSIDCMPFVYLGSQTDLRCVINDHRLFQPFSRAFWPPEGGYRPSWRADRMCHHECGCPPEVPIPVEQWPSISERRCIHPHHDGSHSHHRILRP